MASSNSTPDKLPNGSKSPLSGVKQESVGCLSCAKNFYREKTTKFTLIACPYCGCPHYQGALNNQQRTIFYEAVTAFLKQKQINAEAETKKTLETFFGKHSTNIHKFLLKTESPPLEKEVSKDSEQVSTHQIVEQKATKTTI